MNDIMYTGPKLERELVEVLVRFRRFPVALVCDVAQMYLYISIAPKAQQYHRFLCKDLNQNKVPDHYEFNRLVFGLNSCLFQAQFVTQTHAKKNKELYRRAAETVLQSTYMDNSIDATETEKEGTQLYVDFSKLWKTAGMHARKWISNSTKVLEQIPCEDRGDRVEILEKHLPEVTTLFVQWLPQNDQFTFTVSNVEKGWF